MSYEDRLLGNIRSPGSGSKSSVSEEFRFFRDQPISLSENDEFRYHFYVDTILYILQHSESPINIGLFGKWGVGKSSIIQLLTQKIRSLKDNRFTFIYVDVWRLSPKSLKQELLVEVNDAIADQYSSDKDIKDHVMYTAEQIIDELYYVKEQNEQKQNKPLERLKQIKYDILLFLIPISTGLYTYLSDPVNNSQFVTPVVIASLFPAFVKLLSKFEGLSKSIDVNKKKIIPRAESSQQFQQIFEKIIEKEIGDKKEAVITIDNLDRCDDKTVVEILGMVKTFLNIPKTKFIIACDDEAIQKHLSVMVHSTTDINYGKDFLNKFFQVNLKISPFITGDLMAYTQKALASALINPAPIIAEILTLGVTKNPRKIHQFINDVVVLHHLGNLKEQAKIIQKGTITGNIPFLAKFIVLHEEFPVFYKELQSHEDLLDYADSNLRGQTIPNNMQKILEDMFKNVDLIHFLRSTIGINSPDVSAFIHINQEKFESVISDKQSFKENLIRGDTDSIYRKLETIDSPKRTDYVEDAINIINGYLKESNFIFLSNCINVLIDVYASNILPADAQQKVVYSVGKNIPLIPKTFIDGFNLSNVFKITTTFDARTRNDIFEIYASKLVSDNRINISILGEFINYKKILSDSILELIDINIASKFGDKDGWSTSLSKFSVDDDTRRLFVRSNIIQKLIELIPVEKPQNENEIKNRIKDFMDNYGLTSESDKIIFITRLITLAIMESTDGNSISVGTKCVIETVNNYDIEIPMQISGEFFDALFEITKKLKNEELAMYSASSLLPLYFFELLDEKRKTIFKEFLLTVIGQHTPSSIVTILEYSRKYSSIKETSKDATLLEDEILDSLLERLMRDGPIDSRVIDYIIEFTPDQSRERLAKWIFNFMYPDIPNRIGHIIPKLQAHKNLFSNKSREIVHSSLKELLNKVDPGYKDDIETTIDLFNE